MPKLIDYPRTSYTSAWEVAEVVDDTGGKCALETCARKLNRKVSGSFKAIVGSAVKFGLLTSKRELLTTTTLFRRIKHAYDKQEELLFHREAFLTPALFTQVCRKFRLRELPVAMLDVLLIREFDVEEINAQSVAKAFVDGARMVGVLDEHNLVADVDQLSARQSPARELASPAPSSNTFREQTATPATGITVVNEASLAPTTTKLAAIDSAGDPKRNVSREQPAADNANSGTAVITTAGGLTLPPSRPAPTATSDAIATLFGMTDAGQATNHFTGPTTRSAIPPPPPEVKTPAPGNFVVMAGPPALFRLQLSGPGVNTDLEVTDADDLTLVRALLDKIERQLRRR